MARRVLIFSSLVMVIPSLLLLAFEVFRYDTPLEAWYDDSLWLLYLLLLVFLFWSVVTSYIGVRTAFSVRRLPAVIWFIALPAMFYTVAVGILAFMGASVSMAPPDVANPRTFRSATMSFQYPGNWRIDRADPDFHDASNLSLIASQDAFFRVTLYPSHLSAYGELTATIDAWRDAYPDYRDGDVVDRWGEYEGEGYHLEVDEGGVPLHVFMLVVPLGEGLYMEVLQTAALDVRDDSQAGFDLIASTFKVDRAALRRLADEYEMQE